MTSTQWASDDELFARAKETLFTAVVGDVMDRLGHVRQFLPPRIRPLRDDMVVLGRAMTVLEADVPGGRSERGNNALLDKSFGLMLEALDSLAPHEVYICAGASPRYALWGENMTTRAMQLKAAGAVVDGFSRDTRGIRQLGFPTFSYGPYAQDQAPRGKVIDFRVPIEMDGVRITPGDIVFGDVDGVVIVPRAIEEEVFSRAFERAAGENTVNLALRRGMSATEAYNSYGIL